MWNFGCNIRELFTGSLFKLDASHPNLTLGTVSPSLSSGLLSNKPDTEDCNTGEKSDKKNIFLQFLSTATTRFVYIYNNFTTSLYVIEIPFAKTHNQNYHLNRGVFMRKFLIEAMTWLWYVTVIYKNGYLLFHVMWGIQTPLCCFCIPNLFVCYECLFTCCQNVHLY